MRSSRSSPPDAGHARFERPSVGAPFEHTMIERGALGERDVQIDVKYCDICAWES
jgi:D-arabinose 1-dehydrogenase-like Zn-dependent alcohol dehydrogenase